MRYIMILLFLLCTLTTLYAQDETVHTLQSDDTLESLANTYNTCRQAIVYYNDLTRKGIFSTYYLLEEGTELVILPKSACDTLPVTMMTYVVQEGDTPRSLYAKFHYPDAHIYPNERSFDGYIDLNDKLEVGDELIVTDIRPFYNNTTDILVVDENFRTEPLEYEVQPGDTLNALANRFQSCRDAIVWENMLVAPRQESIAYVLQEGDTLVIPPASHCDDLPFGRVTIFAEEGDTQADIIARYNQFSNLYYQRNLQVEGELEAGTEQVIPNPEYLFQTGLDIYVMEKNADTTPQIHILQQGDTFQKLLQVYPACASAIIYANDLERTSSIDPTFILPVGTALKIPPPIACDTVPAGKITYIVEKGDALSEIAAEYGYHYSQIVDASDTRIPNPNNIDVGLELTIPDQYGKYRGRYQDRLLIYDEEQDRIEFFSVFTPLSSVAQCYGVDIWELTEANGLEYTGYNGGSLVIRNPQHDCMLKTYSNVTFACYEKRLEELVGLPVPEEQTYAFVDENNNQTCYTINQAYEVLFKDKPVILYDQTYNHFFTPTNVETPWNLSIYMIDYCFKSTNTEPVDVKYSEYGSDIVPPADYIKVYAQPYGTTCNKAIFDDPYLYQVQAGDSMVRLSKSYGVLPQMLAEANGIENPSILYVGQYLKIPTPTLFHLIQGIAVIVVLFVAIFGIRYGLRREPMPKSKRKNEVLQ